MRVALAALGALLALLCTQEAAAAQQPKTIAELLEQQGHPLAHLGSAHQIPSGGSRDHLSFTPSQNKSRHASEEEADSRRDLSTAQGTQGQEDGIKRSTAPASSLHSSRSLHRLRHRKLADGLAGSTPQPRAAGNASYPRADGGSWTEAFALAKSLLGQMTLEEKVNLTTGISSPACSGNTGSVPRLGIPSLCLNDGPSGVRGTLNVSQFPAQITTAATWDTELAAHRAAAMGREFHDLGVNYMFAPVTGGPLGRSPLGGRNWEGSGSDEYLTGELSYAAVKAGQEAGVVAVLKHWIGYEQETDRNVHTILPIFQEPISANIDDKTLHETYAWAFAEAVRAGGGMVMCSYNRVNGTHACQDDYTMNTVLKGQLNFQGSVVSDYGAVYTLTESVTGGLDMIMPGNGIGIGELAVLPNYFGTNGKKLAKLVEDGELDEALVDDKVLRILTPVFQYQGHPSKLPPTVIKQSTSSWSGPFPNVQRDHYKVIRKIGTESITLLKNNDDEERGLPLQLPKLGNIAVIGQDSVASTDNMALCDNLGECILPQGTRTMGVGSGFTTPPYVIDPLSAIELYVEEHGSNATVTSASSFLSTSTAVSHAKEADAALVFVGVKEAEGADRDSYSLDSFDKKLIEKVSAVNNNTIVVLHSPAAVDLEDWITSENVTAVLYAYYPGQESGSSLTPILFGDKSPSGRVSDRRIARLAACTLPTSDTMPPPPLQLPFVIGKSIDDYPPNGIASPSGYKPAVNFTEGNLIDWKWFDTKDITPRYAFGHGLSVSVGVHSAIRRRSGKLTLLSNCAERPSSTPPSNTASFR